MALPWLKQAKKLDDIHFQYLSTGILPFDLVMRGIPLGALSEIVGWYGTGKTHFAVQMGLRAIKQGYTVVYFDQESALESSRILSLASHLGLSKEDIQDRFLIFTKEELPFAEMVLERILDLLKDAQNNPDVKYFIVLDSVASLITQGRASGDDKAAVNPLPALLSEFIKHALLHLGPSCSNVAVLFLNQLRDQIQIGPIPVRSGISLETGKVPGGNAIKFGAFLRMEIVRTKALRETYKGETFDIGHEVLLRITKHKAAPRAQIPAFFEYEYGFCPWRNAIELLLAKKVLTLSGGRIEIGGKKLYKKEVVQRLRDGDEEMRKALQDLIENNRHKLVPEPLKESSKDTPAKLLVESLGFVSSLNQEEKEDEGVGSQD